MTNKVDYISLIKNFFISKTLTYIYSNGIMYKIDAFQKNVPGTSCTNLANKCGRLFCLLRPIIGRLFVISFLKWPVLFILDCFYKTLKKIISLLL